MKTLKINLLFALLVLLLAACSGTGEPPEAGKTVDEILAEQDLKIVQEIDKIVAFNVNDWRYVNRRNVVLRDGPSRYYLVELNTICPNLEFAQAIGFTSFGRIVRKNEFILVTDAPGQVERCLISKFFELEKIGEGAAD